MQPEDAGGAEVVVGGAGRDVVAGCDVVGGAVVAGCVVGALELCDVAWGADVEGFAEFEVGLVAAGAEVTAGAADEAAAPSGELVADEAAVAVVEL